MKAGSVLEIRGLGKDFVVHQLGKTLRACHGISLSVGAGEFVGITGRSGSGKSTILKIIHRTYLPQDGEVWYDSVRFGPLDLCRADERQVLYLRRREIGYVSQFLHVIPRTTAREIIEQAAREVDRTPAEAAADAESILVHFELDPALWDSYPGSFSGGEKLRLNIARAMVKRPRLLLLDEPTASLDRHAKERVRLLVEQLKAGGTTMLGIFHDLEFMDGLCDREFNMSLGLLAESGA
jgi:alpha-D-ribose 1-methylphosphonate 5-triphosphate synthase subunit PhnL